MIRETLELKDLPRTFVTADCHFLDKFVIDYKSRPFFGTNAMHDEMIFNWNSVVGVDDIVWHLGDFSPGDARATAGIMKRLNGNIKLLLGDHDHRYWQEIEDLVPHVTCYQDSMVCLYVDIGKEKDLAIILCHWPLRAWMYSNQGSLHLHGHSHGNLLDDRMPHSMDVGQDVHDYTPISIYHPFDLFYLHNPTHPAHSMREKSYETK